jgi:iron transport multicopper oxidase
MSCDPNYIFSIDSHDLLVIETDGILVQPQKVDKIQIFAAQRYSFVLNANQKNDNYWVRAKPDSANSTTFNNGINSAILRYKGAPNKEPIVRNNATQPGVLLSDLSNNDLHPLANPAAPGKPFLGGADKVINLQLGFNFTNGRVSDYDIVHLFLISFQVFNQQPNFYSPFCSCSSPDSQWSQARPGIASKG